MKATRQQLLNLAMGREVTFECAGLCEIINCDDIQDCPNCPLYDPDEFLKQEIEIPSVWAE